MGRTFAPIPVIILLCFTSAANAQSIEWSVLNPFRFYKKESDFERHRNAYDHVRGQSTDGNLIERMELHLNAPGCTDPTSIETCINSQISGSQFLKQQRGWAAESYGNGSNFCYANRRHSQSCMRSYSFDNTVSENYIVPETHAVRAQLTTSDRERLQGQTCRWQFATIEKNQDCKDPIVIERVPWPAGLRVRVRTGDTPVADDEIKVTDILVVGFGDSFAAGEGNPDIPIRPHPTWARPYANSGYGLPVRTTSEQLDPDALPNSVFYDAAARWLSPECHRSQYSYQFRVALQLAIEDSKRAVTFVHLACTGAEITGGLFGKKPAREHVSETDEVPSQFDQIYDLLCSERRETFQVQLRKPVHFGHARMKAETYFIKGCRPNHLRRPIDVALLSFGGNDIGFSALVGFSMIDRAGRIAPGLPLMEAFTGERSTFGPDIGRIYLRELDRRFAVAKDFLQRRLGVPPGRVVQTAYESMQLSENGVLCEGTWGLDVHPGFSFIPWRLRAVDRFSNDFFNRLACIADVRLGRNCPANLATGRGTGFRFVDTHQKLFVKRGLCAAESSNARKFLRMSAIRPREGTIADHFEPWRPHWYLPYGPKRRLFVGPNDAFLTANTHMDGSSASALNTHAQFAYAALYSGSFHPTAEAHAIIADHVMPHVRAALLEQQQGNITVRPVINQQ